MPKDHGILISSHASETPKFHLLIILIPNFSLASLFKLTVIKISSSRKLDIVSQKSKHFYELSLEIKI